MPIDAITDHARRRVTLTVTGDVTAAEVFAFIRSAEAVPGDARPYDLLVDQRLANVDVRTSAEARQLASAAEAAQPARRSGGIALVASNDAMFGLARMYAAHRGQSGITIEVFRSIEDAERWFAHRASAA